MNSTIAREIFLKGTHGVGIQDKKPPGRFGIGLSEPQTATTSAQTATTSAQTATGQLSGSNDMADDRPKHHGSETRQTDLIWGRVPFHIKAEVLRMGKQHGWTESYTVRTLVEQALARNIGEQFAVMIRNTIQEAVRTELQKGREWLRKISLSNFLAAEQARLHAIDVHRLLIPPKEDVNKKIQENRSQAFKDLSFYFRAIEVNDEQQSWPSLK
jgi:hypothetical protein